MSDQVVPQNLSPEHLITLWEITGEMNSSLDFDVALNNVMDSMMRITKAERGFLMIADDNGALNVLVVKAVDGKPPEEAGYSTSVVKEVVRSRKTVLTNDAPSAEGFTPGESIIMRGLRAILCAPMLVKEPGGEERLMGIVYVDTSMRGGSFSTDDRDLLDAVAGQAAIALENARLYTVAVEKGRMEKELQMAADIQHALIPQTMPDVTGYEVAPLWQAARETAGDFYDVFALEEDKFGVVIADVSDKGAGAALFMAVARTMIRANAHVGLSPVDTIGRTNDLILEDAESGMFVTVYHSHFYPDGHSVHVNAGHNPPLFYHQASHSVDFLPRGGRAVGWFPDNPLEEFLIDLQPGDFIVYYTDGLTEAENPNQEAYGEERLAELILQNAGRSAHDLLAIIMEDVETFIAGEPPFDDITVVVVRYVG